MMRQSRTWVNMRRNTLIKNAISSSRHDSQETTSLNEDIERSSVLEDRIYPTPIVGAYSNFAVRYVGACCILCIACNASN